MAERILLKSLKREALANAKTSIETAWPDQDFPHAVRMVYDTTYKKDDPMRTLMVEKTIETALRLVPNAVHTTLMAEVHDFARDIAIMMLKRCKCGNWFKAESVWHNTC